MPLNTLTWQKCLASLAPSGTIEITSNGEYDVMGYAVANVNVAGGGDAEHDITCYNVVMGEPVEITSFVYEAEWTYNDEFDYWYWGAKNDTPLTSARTGTVLIAAIGGDLGVYDTLEDFTGGTEPLPVNNNVFVMPSYDACCFNVPWM